MDKKWFVHALKATLMSAALSMSIGYAEERFPAQMQGATIPLKRCSEAEVNAYRYIHVGNAALYLEDCTQLASIFANTAKHLRFAYDQDIPAHAFQEASVEYLKINLGKKYAQWQKQFEQFNSHYHNVKAGDYYDLIYHPQTGLRLQLNGQDLATIKEHEAGLAYLNVWFGEEPFSEALKSQLLKQGS